jgi:hypothetical protein
MIYDVTSLVATCYAPVYRLMLVTDSWHAYCDSVLAFAVYCYRSDQSLLYFVDQLS